MGLFYDVTFADNRPEFVGLPVEDIKNYNATMDEAYKTNVAQADAIQMAIETLPVEARSKPNVDAALSNLKKTVDPYALEGNMEKAGMAVNKAAKDFASDKNLQASVKSYQQQQAWLAKIDELEAKYMESGGKGGISTEQAMYHRTLSNMTNGNKPAPIYDDITGGYNNMFTGSNPAMYVDVEAEIADMVSKLKASGYSTNPALNKYAQEFYGINDVSGVSASQLEAMVKSYVMSSDKVKAYLTDKTMGDIFYYSYTNNGGEVKFDEITGKIMPNISAQNLKDAGYDINSVNKDGKPIYKDVLNADGSINQAAAVGLLFNNKVDDLANFGKTFAYQTSKLRMYKKPTDDGFGGGSNKDWTSLLKFTSAGSEVNVDVLKVKDVPKNIELLEHSISFYEEALKDPSLKKTTKDRYTKQLDLDKEQLSKYKSYGTAAEDKLLVNKYGKEYNTTDPDEIRSKLKAHNNNVAANVDRQLTNYATSKGIEVVELNSRNKAFNETMWNKTGYIGRKVGDKVYIVPETQIDEFDGKKLGVVYQSGYKQETFSDDEIDKNMTIDLSIQPQMVELDPDVAKRLATMYDDGYSDWKVISNGRVIMKDKDMPVDVKMTSISQDKVDGKDNYIAGTDKNGNRYYFIPPNSTYNSGIISAQLMDDARKVINSNVDESVRTKATEQYQIGMNMFYNQEFSTINTLRNGTGVSIQNDGLNLGYVKEETTADGSYTIVVRPSEDMKGEIQKGLTSGKITGIEPLVNEYDFATHAEARAYLSALKQAVDIINK